MPQSSLIALLLAHLMVPVMIVPIVQIGKLRPKEVKEGRELT